MRLSTSRQERFMPILFLLFLAVPILEIWFLIQIGSVIGAGWTILVVVATAFAGAWLVRSQGLAIIRRIQQETAMGRVPTTDMLEGLVERNNKGFIVTGQDLVVEGKVMGGWKLKRQPFIMETSVPGIFAVGDVRHGSVKRVASAVGEGAIGVSQVHRYLRTV